MFLNEYFRKPFDDDGVLRKAASSRPDYRVHRVRVQIDDGREIHVESQLGELLRQHLVFASCGALAAARDSTEPIGKSPGLGPESFGPLWPALFSDRIEQPLGGCAFSRRWGTCE